VFQLNRNKQKSNRNSLLFHFYTKTESFDVSVEPKQTEDQPNSLIESIFWYFLVLVCFEDTLAS
jgi:hypothetical protein